MTKILHPRKREFIELFQQSGWSQAEAARELQTTRGGLNGIITGPAVPSEALLKLFKLVLFSKGKHAEITDAPMTEAWCNELLFELKRLPQPERDKLVSVFRQIVQLVPTRDVSYGRVNSKDTAAGILKGVVDAADGSSATGSAGPLAAPSNRRRKVG